MGENIAAKNQNHNQHHLHIDVPVQPNFNDGRLKPTGTVSAANAHKITVVIFHGVISSAWATAQLGWIAGPTVMLFFAFVTCYTSTLLAACNGSCDSNLGRVKVRISKLIHYLNLFGDAIGYTIAASISMMAIEQCNCFHASGEKNPCRISNKPYIISFGVAEIIFSQIPGLDQMWWLSIVAAVMSFTYSTIGLGLGVAKVAENGNFKGSLTGISVGMVTEAQKIWRTFQALGAIAFAYSCSSILIEIQDKSRSPMEPKAIKKASLIRVSVTTIFYMLCGCVGYAAFGDLSPGNLLTGFGVYNPYWLLDIAHAAIVVHLVGAYQVDCRSLLAFIENQASDWFPDSDFFSKDTIRIPGVKRYKLNLFRLVWRTIFVIVTTMISMLMPFFNDVFGILGAFGFWPLIVYFPVEMYIVHKKIRKWSTKWVCLQILSIACFVISITAASGSIARIVLDLKFYKPFSTSYE